MTGHSVQLKYMGKWELSILLLTMKGKSLPIKLFVSLAATRATPAKRHKLNFSAYLAMRQRDWTQAALN